MNRLIRSACAVAAVAATLAAIPARASASPFREPRSAGPAPTWTPAPPRPEYRAPARGRFEDREREYRELAAARERFYAARHSRWERERFERGEMARRADLDRRWNDRHESFDRR
jgi:hypothetical protein